MGNLFTNVLRGGRRASMAKTSPTPVASAARTSQPVRKSTRPREEELLGPAFRDASTSATRTPSRFAAYGARAKDLGRRAFRYLDPRGNKWKMGLYGAAGLSFPAAAFSDIVNSENEYDAMAEGIDDTFGTWFGSGTYDSARNLSGQSPADDYWFGRMLGLGEVIGRMPRLVDGIKSIPTAVMNPGRTFRNARGYVKGLTGMYDQGDIDKALANRQHIQGVYNGPQDAILEAAGNELRNGGTYQGAMSGMVHAQNLVSNALSKLNAGVPLNDSERQALAARGYSVPGGYNNQTRMAQTRR